MNVSVPENRKISPFLVFFLVTKMQIGIGVLGFQRIIASDAGYDSWISILITGIAIHIVLWMMLKMLKMSNGDLISIHQYLFGKKLSKLIGIFFVVYFCGLTTTVLRTYIEVIQVWMFPQLSTFWFGVAFLLVVIYTIFGGFRTVTGIAFFGLVLPFYILLFFLFTIPYSEYDNLLPLFDQSWRNILKASKDMSLTVLGFEAILVFYPFIKKPDESKKWAHLGVAYTTFVCLYLAIITFGYFPEAQLQKYIWPTLTMWKIIQLPFVERFEYIGIANCFLIILPNASISLWCASRIAKRVFSFKQRKSVPTLALFCLIGTSLLFTREQINMLTSTIGIIGFYMNFTYIPILFIATIIARKVKNR